MSMAPTSDDNHTTVNDTVMIKSDVPNKSCKTETKIIINSSSPSAPSSSTSSTTTTTTKPPMGMKSDNTVSTQDIPALAIIAVTESEANNIVSNNQMLTSSAIYSANTTKRPSTSTTTTTTTTTTDMDLKSSIIEFMRVRPFLWNNKHPNYKDHKRRDHEFQEFSKEIGVPVTEIKRVWHVLRTNFFRAHKLLLEKPHNQNNNNGSNSGENGGGEKLWKYYLAMEYILEGTNVDPTNRNNNNNSAVNSSVMNDDSCSSKDTTSTPTPTRYGRARYSRDSTNSAKKEASTTNQNACVTTNNLSTMNNTLPGGTNQLCRISGRVHYRNDNNNISLNSSNNSNHHHYVKSLNGSSVFNDSMMEADDDHLYARSLTATLKKFDPTTKEVIKLKFQEIIVDHMQKQQQQQQHQNHKQHSSIEQMSS